MPENLKRDFILPQFLLDILVDTVIVVLMVIVIRFSLFAPFQIHGQSMCDSFNVYNGECYTGDGEYVLTSRLSTWNLWGWSPTRLQRGDVLIFQAPYSEEGEFYIKRVIGLPGETVKIEKGEVSIMNETGNYLILKEPYLNEENQGNTDPYRTTSQIFEVPEEKYFVLGDNRIKSNDSRRCFQQTGCTSDTSPYLGMELIEGEVKLVFFPLGHFGWVSPISYEI